MTDVDVARTKTRRTARIIKQLKRFTLLSRIFVSLCFLLSFVLGKCNVEYITSICSATILLQGHWDREDFPDQEVLATARFHTTHIHRRAIIKDLKSYFTNIS